MTTPQENAVPSPRVKSTSDKFGGFVKNDIWQLIYPLLGGGILMVVNYLFGYVNCCCFKGRKVEEREQRKLEKERHNEQMRKSDEQMRKMDEQMRKLDELQGQFKPAEDCQETTHHWSPKNGLDGPLSIGRDDVIQRKGDAAEFRNRKHNLGNKASTSSANTTCSGYNDCASQGDLTQGDPENLSPPDAIVLVILPDPVEEIAQALAEEKLGTVEMVTKGSRILQFRASLDVYFLAKLRNVAVACTDVDKRIMVQFGRRVFIRNANDIVEMNTLESDEVPVILRSIYAAGKLTIEGLNLGNATIIAATSDECITLKNIEHPQVSEGVQVCTWNVQLPSRNFEEVAVHAVKTCQINNQDVSVYSSVVKIQDNTLRAVIRIGMPNLVLFIYIARQLYFAFQSMEWPDLGLDPWILACFGAILSQCVPSWIDNVVRGWLEHVRLINWALYFSMRSFLFKQSPGKPIQEHGRKLLNGDSRVSNDNFDAGYELPTESANAASTRGLALMTDAITALNGTILEYVRKSQESESEDDHDEDDQGLAVGTSREDKTDSEPAIDEDLEWQAQEEYVTKSGRMKLRKCGDEKKEDAPIKTKRPFDVVYGLKNKRWPDRDYINIYSPFLMEIIVGLVPKLRYDEDEKSLRVYGGTLFHIRQKLTEFASNGVDTVSPEERVKQQLHVGLLLRFMEKELKDVLTQYSAMEKGGYVSWDMLWAFMPTGTQVVHHCKITDEELLGVVTKTSYYTDLQGQQKFIISIAKWDYDCSTWKSYEENVDIMKFDGECGFTTLRAFPLQFQADPEKAVKEFLQRGDSFCYLSMRARNRYMKYNGLIYMMKTVGGCLMLQKEDASGRVMVDLASFHKMNPSYPMRSAEPPCEVLRDNKVKCIDISSREDRRYAPAMVYGFSFRLKKWGTFLVCGFSEIVFNDKAFEALVMPEARKKLVETLVRQNIQKEITATTRGSEQAQQSQQLDLIESKGEGCIILCYGGPGTGKTLTAESLSEKLHAPLWSVSVSELGTKPQELETYLVKVLDIAATWGAILLLDEADVYLEKRAGFDLTRTAMTGIFLRTLEYYRGVLFLTSNRVVAFDDAFRSRISMILYYEITEDERQEIWKTILNRVRDLKLSDELNRVKDLEFSDEDYARFAKAELNGRDIRNVVQRAMILAEAEGHPLRVADIQASLTETIRSIEVLKAFED